MIEQNPSIRNVARVDDALLDAGIFQPVDQSTNEGTVILTCVIPRLVLGEPDMPQLMNRIADQVVMGALGNVCLVIEVWEDDSSNHALGFTGERDSGCLACPTERQAVEFTTSRLEDALDRSLNASLEFET